MGLAARLGRHPLAHLPRRVVAHVLAMAALELRHPVAELVDVVADDAPRDAAIALHRLTPHNGPRASSQVVVDGRDDAHDLGDLAFFGDACRLVARENLEDALARGEFARLPLHWDDKARQLTIGRREGQFRGMAATRRIGVVVHGNGAGPVFEQAPERWIDYSGEAVELKL